MEKPSLFCEIGDKLEFIAAIDSQNIKKGDVYKTVDLVGYGWDLERIEGDGAFFIRILNSEMSRYLTLSEK